MYRGLDLNLHILVFNATFGTEINGSLASCYLSLYNPDEERTSFTEIQYNSTEQQYILFIDKKNFTALGDHSFIIKCNTSSINGGGVGGFVNGIFTVIDYGDNSNLNNTTFWLVFIIFFVLIIAFLFLLHTFQKDITAVMLYGSIAGVICLIYIQYLLNTLNIIAFNLTWTLISLVIALTLYFFIVGATFRKQRQENE